MSSLDSKGRYPQDIVAIFHATFHPTQGNIIDWALKASEDLNLDNLEFSALPSGLHLVEQDVVDDSCCAQDLSCVPSDIALETRRILLEMRTGKHGLDSAWCTWVDHTLELVLAFFQLLTALRRYFTKDNQHGVCVFRRRKTLDKGHRGFHLSSLGILLAKSARPRPWKHTAALKELTSIIYSRFESSASLIPTESDWDPARTFFNERKVSRADLGGAGDWNGWSHELLERLEEEPTEQNPTLHLPHLLRILGPSSLTLYKHVLSRKRILIYTLPPVEAASILCQVAADMCYEHQVEYTTSPGSPSSRLRGKCKEGISVLGMVTLNDMDRLVTEGKSGRGWVACTTDAIFLEKPSCYDLLIDLTTSTPNKATRPTFYASRPVQPPSPGPSRPRGPTHRLSVVRFSWSDLKLWNELSRILQLDSSASHDPSCCSLPSLSQNPKANPITAWTDAWRVYEDVCVICAGLWMGSWRGNSAASYSTAGGASNWGAVRLEGDEDLTLRGLGGEASGHVRSVGMGIEGGPKVGASGSALSMSTTSKTARRSSGMSWASSKATVNGPAAKGKGVASPVPDGEDDEETYDTARRDGHILTTLSLLQTLHAYTAFQLSMLESFLPKGNATGRVIALTSKDMAIFELGPLSGMDARYLEWFANEYGGGASFVIRRGWKEMIGAIFGYG